MAEDRTLYIMAALTPVKLDEAREKTHALAPFQNEMVGLAGILDGIAADHPEAVEDLAKVASAIRIGKHFAGHCTGRLPFIFDDAHVNDPERRRK